jgi:hypothetical protein
MFVWCWEPLSRSSELTLLGGLTRRPPGSMPVHRSHKLHGHLVHTKNRRCKLAAPSDRPGVAAASAVRRLARGLCVRSALPLDRTPSGGRRRPRQRASASVRGQGTFTRSAGRARAAAFTA